MNDERYVKIILENGFQYQGVILEETETELTIRDIRSGKATFRKDKVMVRFDE